MLTTLENWLIEAARDALPDGLRLAAGPTLPPVANALPLLTVTATRLRPTRRRRHEEPDTREPVYVTSRLTLPGDGVAFDFALPAETVEQQVVEVELSPGHLARRGDDYQVKKDSATGKDRRPDTLSFYRPPPASFSVLLRGRSKANGYRQVLRCRATIEIDAWAAQAAASDDLLTPALAAVLTALAQVDQLELAGNEQAGFSLRLLNPRADLAAIERTAVAGETPLCRSSARLSLHGELELTLSGRALAEDEIKRIDYEVWTLSPTGEKEKRMQTGSIERTADDASH